MLRFSPTVPRHATMSQTNRMYRPEFEERAQIGKTSFFSLLADPEVQTRLEYAVDARGRANVDRRRALQYIKELQLEHVERRRRRASHLGAYATPNAPARGRPCPSCRKRIARRAAVCRHCGDAMASVVGRE